MSLADFIRERRTMLDISKAEAARRAGVSRRTWAEVEEGKRVNVTQLTLSQIDQALQIPEGTLYAMTSRSGSRRIESLRQRSIELIRKMTGDEMQVLLDSEGTETFRSILTELRTELAELRAELTELRRERGEPEGRSGDSPEKHPGGRPGERPGGRPLQTDQPDGEPSNGERSSL